MKSASKFDLIVAAVVSVGLVVAGSIFSPWKSTAQHVIFYVACYGSGVIVIGGIYWILRARNKLTEWQQPVAGRTGAIIANTVVSVWLIVACVILYAVLEAQAPATIAIALGVFMVGGLGGGVYLRKHFLNVLLLPYGISVLGALVLVLLII